MKRKSMLALEIMALGVAFGARMPTISPRERDLQPRKFTDARKAEAEKKRQRKNARRAAQYHRED